MGTVRRTITVTDEQVGWIKAQIEAGHYISDSDCIRDLIRRDQVFSAERDAIRSALVFGEASGESRPFDPDGFKQRMLAERG
ncbi:ribbon-helix-helix domain-containing protein [Pseudomonas lundensis]|uniref:ribbon-helix-helix domain-containing protein n=1 Tax=Pseudomonas lundensis TaxID=86185 RepID=UPI0039083E94